MTRPRNFWLPTIKRMFSFAGANSSPASSASKKTKTLTTSSSSGSRSSCPLHANSSHQIDTCRAFSKSSVDERKNTVKRLGLCFICLAPHMSSQCTKSTGCESCHKKHHRLLCHAKKETQAADKRKVGEEVSKNAVILLSSTHNSHRDFGLSLIHI